MKTIAALILLLLESVTLRAASTVQINEFMASNTRAFPDITDFEDYPDWLELKNSSASAVSLDGYFLSDNPANPFKWQIPAGDEGQMVAASLRGVFLKWLIDEGFGAIHHRLLFIEYLPGVAHLDCGSEVEFPIAR